MDLLRAISIYGLLNVLIFAFLFIAFKIIKRNKSTLSKYLFAFFVTQSAPWILNLIYAPLTITPIVTFLHLTAIFIGMVGMTNLTIALLILWKSKHIITRKVQFTILISYTVFFSLFYIIPEGLIINESTGWKPLYNLHFSLFAFFNLLLLHLIPILYLSYKIYASFQTRELKKQWKYFLSGILLYFCILISTSFLNLFLDMFFKILIFIFGLLSIPSGYLIYRGIGKVNL